MRGLDSDSGQEDEDWQGSLASWKSSRRSSLQATGAVPRIRLVDTVRAEGAAAEALRVSAEVRLRNRPLSDRIRAKFQSLHDSDLSEDGDGGSFWGRRSASAHTVEELLALRATPAEAAAAASSGDCSRLGLRLGVKTDGHLIRVTSVDLDSPADRSGIRPGDEILSVDGAPADGECRSDVERSVADSVLADGVVHVRVRRRLPEPREPSAPPLPPLDTLPAGEQPAGVEASQFHNIRREEHTIYLPRRSMPNILQDGKLVIKMRTKRNQPQGDVASDCSQGATNSTGVVGSTRVKYLRDQLQEGSKGVRLHNGPPDNEQSRQPLDIAAASGALRQQQIRHQSTVVKDYRL